MSLSSAVQGARYTGQRITWRDKDGDAQNLTGATLTGRLRNRETGVARAIDGTLTVDGDATEGVFVWAYGATDVSEAGKFDAQFIATYGGGLADKTMLERWTVVEAI